MDEYCPGVGRRCYKPEKCCLSGTMCCVPHGQISRDFSENVPFLQESVRFSFVDLWYFWFAVLFIITACTGICAFWRRQRRLLQLLTGQTTASRWPSETLVETRRGLQIQTLVDHHHRLHVDDTTDDLSYYAAVFSTAEPDFLPPEPLREFTNPPSYAEVAATCGGKSTTDPNQSGLPSYADVYEAAAPMEPDSWSRAPPLSSLPSYTTSPSDLPVYCLSTTSTVTPPFSSPSHSTRQNQE